jgi:hypothetical protein
MPTEDLGIVYGVSLMSIVQDAVLLMLWKIRRYDGIFDGVNCKHDGFFDGVNCRCDRYI